MHCVTPRAFRAFPKGLQGGTLPWGSLWERKRSLASQLPLMSFLVGGILPYGKLTPHTLGSSVAAWESGTMPQKVIFPKSKIGGVLVHGRDTDQETEEEELEGIWEGAECYCVVFDQFLKNNYFYQNKHYEVTYVDSAFTSYVLRLNLPIGVDSPSDVRHVLSINAIVVFSFPVIPPNTTLVLDICKVVAAALPSSLAPRVWFLFYCVCSQVSSGIEWSVHAL